MEVMNDLAKHIFDTGVALNKAAAEAFQAPTPFKLVYLLENSNHAALGCFSTRQKAEAVKKELPFEATIREEVVY